jgi:transposase-like protein
MGIVSGRDTVRKDALAAMTMNVLDKLPRGQQVSAKNMLHEIWMAATKEDALKAFDKFAATYQGKSPRRWNAC